MAACSGTATMKSEASSPPSPIGRLVRTSLRSNDSTDFGIRIIYGVLLYVRNTLRSIKMGAFDPNGSGATDDEIQMEKNAGLIMGVG